MDLVRIGGILPHQERLMNPLRIPHVPEVIAAGVGAHSAVAEVENQREREREGERGVPGKGQHPIVSHDSRPPAVGCGLHFGCVDDHRWWG
jgi:hypothetical protein